MLVTNENIREVLKTVSIACNEDSVIEIQEKRYFDIMHDTEDREIVPHGHDLDGDVAVLVKVDSVVHALPVFAETRKERNQRIMSRMEVQVNPYVEENPIISTLRSDAKVVAAAKAVGMDCNCNLYWVSVRPKGDDDYLNEIFEESIDAFEYLEGVLDKVTDNCSSQDFTVGHVFVGTLNGLPVIACQWDFTGASFYTTIKSNEE